MDRRRTGALAVLAALAASACTAAPDSEGEDGAQAGPGVSDDAIRVLALNDLSGPAASSGKPIQAGLDAYVAALNERGGIDGRDLELVVADTQYDPQKAAQAYQGAANDVAAVWSHGTPTTDAVRSFTADDDTLLLGIKGPYPEPNTFAVMNAYEVDTALLLDHVLEQDPEARIGAIYQADALGEGIARGVEAVAEATGLELVAETTVDATAQDLTAQVSAMRRAGADHVLLGVSPGALTAAAGAVASLGYEAQLLNPGSGYTRSQLDLPVGATLETSLLSTCSYPLWDDEGEEMVALKEALGDVEPHGSYVNGWISGMILEAVLRQAAEDGDLSHAGIVAAAGRTTVDTNGLTPAIEYGESFGERTPYREGRLCRAARDDDGFELVEDWFTSDAAQAVALE